MFARRYRLRVTALAAAAALFLAGCGGSDDDAGAADNERAITVAIATPVSNMDGTVSNSAEVNGMIYGMLTRYGKDGELQPDLAEGWEANDDSTVWTFKIRPDLKFSDGSPLTIDDIIFTFETGMANEKSLLTSYYSQIDAVAKVGEDSVEFTLKAPNSTWFRMVGYLPIVSEVAYTERGADGYASNPLGAGPYVLSAYENGKKLTLTANSHYWEGGPAVTNVVVEVVEDATTRLTGLQSGQFDVATVGGPNVPTAEAAGLTIASGSAPMTVYLGYTFEEAGLDDPKLREAISYAIDRDALVDSVLLGRAASASQLAPATAFGHDPSLPALPYDREKAQELVAESGYAGEPITFTYPSGAYVPEVGDVAQALANFLGEAGINVELQRVDSSSFFDSWFAKSLPGIWLMSDNSPSLDATSTFKYLNTIVNTFTDDDILDLYSQQLGEPNQDERADILGEMARINNDNAYYAPLFYPEIHFAYQASKVGVDFNPSGYIAPHLMTPAA